MEHYYLIDFENVREAGLIGAGELGSDSHIYLFYTENANRLALDAIAGINAEFRAVKVAAGRQSLDMHLISFLGYIIGRTADAGRSEYVVISNDKGFDGTCAFWNASGLAECSRRGHITKKSVTVKPVEEPAEPRTETTQKNRSQRNDRRGQRNDRRVIAKQEELPAAAQPAPAAESESAPEETASFIEEDTAAVNAEEAVIIEEAPAPETAPEEAPAAAEMAEDAPAAEAAAEGPAAEEASAEPAAAEKKASRSRHGRNNRRNHRDKAQNAGNQPAAADAGTAPAPEAAPEAGPVPEETPAEGPAPAEEKPAQAPSGEKHEQASAKPASVSPKIAEALAAVGHSELTGKVTEIILACASKKNVKQAVYREIIRAYGQKQGLETYGLIKKFI